MDSHMLRCKLFFYVASLCPLGGDGVLNVRKRHNFFCLKSYPGEISHSNSPNRELSNDLSDVVVRQRKVALHTIFTPYAN